MKYRYVVLGAGRQGAAATYDLVLHGEAEQVILADANLSVATRTAERVNRLLRSTRITPMQVDVADRSALVTTLQGAAAALSAVPYRFNRLITEAAIEAGCHLCDLGGHTGMVLEQLASHDAAMAAGVAVVPDCGLQPGMGNLLAVHGMEQMEQPKTVSIWVGGLPKQPRAPFNYLLSFNVEGLTHEYDGTVEILRDGRRIEVPPFSDLEEIEFPDPVGRCEAFLTSGGASTCPATFEGRLDRYEEKTVRYPGHAATFQAFGALGLFSRDPVRVGADEVVPRDLYHALLEPRIRFEEDEDIVVLRVSCQGESNGRSVEVIYDLMDAYDAPTGFRAMERTTGFSAAIVAAMLARNEIAPGALPPEISVPAAPFLAQARRRGFAITVREEQV